MTLVMGGSVTEALDKESPRNDFILPMALILGGSYGNFVERYKKGYVTDFLLIDKGKHSPVFNIADLSLFSGIILFYIILIIQKCQK